MEQKIYFDNSASTRVDPRVVAEMLPFFGDCFGNPSSLHCFGRESRDAIDCALMSILGFRVMRVKV